MEQKKSMTLINDAQNEIDQQKKKTLNATELKIKTDQAKVKIIEDLKIATAQIDQLTNDLAVIKNNLKSKITEHASKAEAHEAAKEEIREIQSQLAEAKEIVNKTEQIHKENAILRSHNNTQKETITRHKQDLDNAIEQLKLFTDTGLNPAEINGLKQKRLITIDSVAHPKIKTIRPPKITVPLQRND